MLNQWTTFYVSVGGLKIYGQRFFRGGGRRMTLRFREGRLQICRKLNGFLIPRMKFGKLWFGSRCTICGKGGMSWCLKIKMSNWDVFAEIQVKSFSWLRARNQESKALSWSLWLRHPDVAIKGEYIKS